MRVDTVTSVLLLAAVSGCGGACRTEGTAHRAADAPRAVVKGPVPDRPEASTQAGGEGSTPKPVSSGSKAPPGFDLLMRGHHRCPAKPLPTPQLHRHLRDPVFGTQITRVTDPSQWPNVTRVRHFYSKANPFNADDSRAILTNSDGAFILYDVSTWRPIRGLEISSSTAEIQWHPTDPNLLYHLDFVQKSSDVRGFFRYDIRNDSKTLLRDFSDYATARGKLEGNIDKSGRYYAMFGVRSETDIEAFVYDIREDRVGPRLPVTPRMADDWISVSPSSKFVVLMGERTRIYDIEMRHLRDLPEGSFGHGDLCTTEDGRDVLVYDGADRQLDSNRNINVADLATGVEQLGVRIGWKSTPHVSCRNLDFPGWALISTQGGDGVYPNHDFEVFWLKLDGSGEVRRLAHHHSSRETGGYFAEQHAVTNRDGRLVLFASNWGGAPISDYLVELAEPTPNPGACQ